MSTIPKAMAVLALSLLALAPPSVAQTSDAADPPESVRGGIFTTAQAERGAAVYEKSCSGCHQPEQFTGPGFIDAWSGQTADAPFEVIRTTMPEDNPSSLKRRDYAAVLAYLFSLNGLPTGETDLPSIARKLKLIRIEGVSKGQVKP